MRLLIIHALLCVSIFCIGLPSNALPLVIELKPTKDQYYTGEPISLKLTISNVSKEKVKFAFHYPNYTGLSFHVEKEELQKQENSINEEIPLITLAPNNSLNYTIALNRYLSISQPGSYVIGYVSKLAVIEKEANENIQAVENEKKGSIDIKIIDGNITKKLIAQYIKDLDATDDEKVSETIEMLIWIDSVEVIPILEKGAKRLPSRVGDVVNALSRYIKNNDAQSSLLHIAQDPNNSAMAMTLNIFAENKIVVPSEFIQNIVKKGHIGQVYPLLEYLMVNGTPAEVNLVRPLLNHWNPEVRNLASQFIDKMKKQSDADKNK